MLSSKLQALLVACENAELVGYSVNLGVPSKKCKLQFTLKTNQPKIQHLCHDSKEKYIFASFPDSSIGVYENVGMYRKTPFFIHKVNFFNPVNKIVNTGLRDLLVIQTKRKCVAFSDPQNLKQKFIMQVEQNELNGVLWDPGRRVLWTFGNDKKLRGWEIPEKLFGSEGNCRLLFQWNKDKIFDVLDPKTLTEYVSGDFSKNENLVVSSSLSENDSEEELPEKDDQIKQVTPKSPFPPERNFKEDIQDIVAPVFKKNSKKEQQEQKENQEDQEYEEVVYDSQDENSAAKKYGLVRINKIENLAVSNSENESLDENKIEESPKEIVPLKNEVVDSREENKKSKVLKPAQNSNKKVESESESDDDLTGWF